MYTKQLLQTFRGCSPISNETYIIDNCTNACLFWYLWEDDICVLPLPLCCLTMPSNWLIYYIIQGSIIMCWWVFPPCCMGELIAWLSILTRVEKCEAVRIFIFVYQHFLPCRKLLGDNSHTATTYSNHSLLCSLNLWPPLHHLWRWSCHLHIFHTAIDWLSLNAWCYTHTSSATNPEHYMHCKQ